MICDPEAYHLETNRPLVSSVAAVVALAASAAPAQPQTAVAANSPADLSLEQLSNIEVSSVRTGRKPAGRTGLDLRDHGGRPPALGRDHAAAGAAAGAQPGGDSRKGLALSCRLRTIYWMEKHIGQGVLPLAAAQTSDGAFVPEAKILHGDAFDLFDQLAPSSVDLIVSSPPYWGHRDYGLPHNWELFNNITEVKKIGPQSPGYNWYRKAGGLLGLEPYPEWFVQHLTEIVGKAKRVLKATGSMWINLGDTYFARWASIREQGRQGLGTDERRRRKTPLGGVRQEKNLLLIPARFAISMQEVGWILRNDVIWHKPNAVPRPEGDRLRNVHEHFFHFVKKPTTGRPAYYYAIEEAEAKAGDVVTVGVAPGEGGHSATFPHSLIEPRILTSCPPRGTVLDPFSGTGRVLEIAIESGRNGIGFDVQQAFVSLQKTKLNGNQRTRRELHQ